MPEQDRELSSASSAENFSLAHFARSRGDSFVERVRAFSDYLRETNGRGQALYARELTGPPGPSVRVRDPLTGSQREMVMMGSNNYLGLANHPAVKAAVHAAIDEHGVGMGGPPLLNGMSGLHRQLERRLAALKGKEDALLYPSGFQANLGWLTAVLRSGDAVLVDELHHASLFDGLRLAKSMHGARARVFRHNDLEQLDRGLKRASQRLAPGGRLFVAVEGVYSMDGDLARLPGIVGLCRAYGATLALDDAHGTGVLGRTGAGTAEHFGVEGDIEISMGTFSKTFGVTGGFIAGRRELIDYLRYFSRSYMFSAHLPQTVVAAVLAGLELLETEPGLRERLHANTQAMVRGLRALGYDVATESAIIPVRIPERVDVRELGRRFHEEGLFCNVIEPPAVPAGEQRVRLSLMADHRPEHLDFALGVFARAGRELGLTPSGIA